MPGVYQPGFIK